MLQYNTIMQAHKYPIILNCTTFNTLNQKPPLFFTAFIAKDSDEACKMLAITDNKPIVIKTSAIYTANGACRTKYPDITYPGEIKYTIVKDTAPDNKYLFNPQTL